ILGHQPNSSNAKGGSTKLEHDHLSPFEVRHQWRRTDGFQVGLSGHEEFEETIQTLLGHLLLYVVPGGERLYGHEVAREFAPHRRIFVGRRSPSCPPEDE